METPDVPGILMLARAQGVRARAQETTFYLGRERIIVAVRRRGRREDGARMGIRRAPEGTRQRTSMARWRRSLFVLMSRNARSATEFFGIPPNRVVELGAQVEF